MIYRFADFELDTDRYELRSEGVARPLEPQVYALLTLLVETRERVVSKDELIEKVWDGRLVSESAVSSRVKSARQALGDDGRAQRFIKTIHGRGFRFVADVRAERVDASRESAAVITREGAPAGSHPVEHHDPFAHSPAAGSRGAAAPDADRSTERPSIAVLPFRKFGDDGSELPLADALADELIADLSRLRWLFVTSRVSSFRLRAPRVDPGEAGRLLGVRYVLTGTVETAGDRLSVTALLTDTRDDGVVWAERFAGTVGDVHELRTQIRGQILAALEIHIPQHEAARVRFQASESLDAWSAYHLGLQHMYRFNRSDSATAAALFEQAIARDPGFARAHAGLSFIHFQTAFLRHTEDLAGAAQRAVRCAERGLELDPVDPFVHFTMGRTFWLAGDLEASLPWLERATSISPSYAHGIYARAWTEALAGRGLEARGHADLAMDLSPLDPLHYAMQGTRAFSHMVLGEDAEAAAWAERAARAPGAHVLIAMIATAAHALGGDAERAAEWAANVRARNPALAASDFFRAFPMKSEPTRSRVADALKRLGF